MLIEDTAIEGVKVITPPKFRDERGFFSEAYNESTWEKAGLHYRFVQDNHSLSMSVGAIRGLHFQTHPVAQHKLVRVARGRILDVAVDLRRSSSTFGRHVAVELSAANWRQLLIPIGFAHGFCTMEPNTEILYKVTNFYSAANDRGLAFDDPDLNIAWPVSPDRASIADRDRQWPCLRDLVDTFE
jgi:dTDP-4-dehydrorhamnose 3,5-epimerase